MKAAFTIIGVIIVLLLFGTMLAGIKSAKTDDRTDNFAGVVTGGGATTSPLVLVTDIYKNNILNVVSINSDNVLDAPLPDSYVAASNTLTVRGLHAADTRTLTVVYEYDVMTGDAAAAGTFLGFVPLFVAIAVVVIIVGAAIAVFVTHKGG